MASETNSISPVEIPIGKEQKDKISDLLTEISKLNNAEKFYMHLKLPPCPIVEEIIQSPSPASSSTSNRTSTILKWIQSHYMEDRRVCVPKQDVYNHYMLYSASNGFSPVAVTDFGKIVKTAFPDIQDRRLGQRGKSKYYYGGLRRKPSSCDSDDPETTKLEEQTPFDPEEELESLSSQLVCEWAGCLLGKTFRSIRSLAQYLVCSGAACGKKAALFNMLLDSWGTPSMLPDTQALIQRKLLQKEVLKEHKNLLKQREITQRDTQPQKSTVTRLAVLSPNIQTGDSIDAAINQPSTFHVINISRNSVPQSNSSSGLESSLLADVKVCYSESVGSDGSINMKKGKNSPGWHRMNEAVDGKARKETKKDKTEIKCKQSQLVSSKSVEEGSLRQVKRNCDFLLTTNQGRDRKRRRCITSLGMTGLESQLSEATEDSNNDHNDATLLRPISCPTFYNNTHHIDCDMESDTNTETSTSQQLLQTTETPSMGSDSNNCISIEDVKDTSPLLVESDKASKTENASSSFHFVRKPTVISIKPTGMVDSNDPVDVNTNSNNLSGSESSLVSPVKKSHSILNSILLSSDLSIPQNVGVAERKISSGMPLMQLSSSCNQLSDSKSDCDKGSRKGGPHTLDNAYLLPCQSSRSAFVRVMNGKGHGDGIIPKSKLSSYDDSFFHGHKQSERSLSATNPVTNSKSMKSTTEDDIDKDKQSESLGQTDKESGDDFKPIVLSVSSSETVPSTMVDATAIFNETLTSVSSSSSAITSVKWSNSEPVSSSLPLTNCVTSPVTCQSKGLTNKSPVALSKRQSRSRFTPIRPKIGCCNVSPQKKDTRPVATILKEQRARSAQELLANLASSYQGGIKVQLPAEFLGLSSQDKSKSSDVVVNIGKSSKPDPSVKAPLQGQNKDITVILEPVSISNSSTTQPSALISPLTLISSTPNVSTTSSLSSRMPTLLNTCMVSECVNQSNTVQPFSEVSPASIASTPTALPVQSIESQLVIADAKGTIYSLESEADKTLPHISNVQQLLQTNKTDITHIPVSAQTANVINVSDIRGHVVGPDSMGQTYLLVPNTDTASLPPNMTVTSSSNLTVLSSPVKQTASSMKSRLTPNLALSSSSALLSELSHLASVSKQEKNMQLIQHDSTISAFQKCEPNKPVNVAVKEDLNSQLVSVTDYPNLKNVNHSETEVGEVKSKDSSKSYLVSPHISNDEYHHGHELSDVSVRKRKASKTRDEKLNEKKRQNTNCSQDGVVIMNSDKQDWSSVNVEDMVLGEKDVANMVSEEKMSISKTNCDAKLSNPLELSDTESLLNLISGSRSLTVKQTVMAMNSLKARLKNSNTIGPLMMKSTKDETRVRNASVENVSPNKTEDIDKQIDLIVRNMAGKLDNVAEKTAQRSSHQIRRNTSLNLESLESDALLDTELSLDRHLVEDVKLNRYGSSDHQTSVALVTKTLRSVSADRHRRQSKVANENYVHPTISPKALHSYHMILNEKSRSRKDKKVSDKNSKGVVQRESKECNDKQERNVLSGEFKSSSHHRKSMSSVQDILTRGTEFLDTSCDARGKMSQQELNSLEVDAFDFDTLLSKMHTKHRPNSSMTKSHSVLLQDSEIPVDIVEFVTESMNCRKDASERNFGMECGGTKSGGSNVLKFQSDKHQAPFGARSISVPNTKPDFIDVGQMPKLLPNSVKYSVGLDSKLSIQSSIGDHTAGESGSVSKNVFLSPVGPAKLARRSSVEKSFMLSQTDRSMTRTPIDSLISVKEKQMSDCNNGHRVQNNERDCTKTPVDRLLLSTDKRGHTPNLIQQTRREEHANLRSPVSRSLTKTPIEKFFVKQSSDPLLLQPSSTLREESSSLPAFSSDTGYNGGSVSQTPSSECGQGSVSQTPVSDFGYNSVSPSPVMMSSSSYFGECGRNLSPATIFMPLRSDSALSLNNNTLRSESPASVVQSNMVDNLRDVLSNSHNDVTDTNCSRVTLLQPDKNEQKDSLLELGSDLLEMPSLLDSLGSKVLFLNGQLGTEEAEFKSNPDTKTLLKLLSTSLQSIPTPPVSPNTSPTANNGSSKSLSSFSIPVSPPLPLRDSSHSPSSDVPCFLPPSSSSNSSYPTSHHNSSLQYRISPHCRSQDLPSPAIMAHRYTPSPQILPRPPSSPHPYSSHPSPPFTPCSLRSLPSPRCLTPSSHKSMVSPRCVTPSGDSNQTPNRFMPIQSSGVLPTSLAVTHTYIQPIRPVVTLASVSSSSTSAGEISRCMVTVNPGLLPLSQNTGGLNLKNSQTFSTELKNRQSVVTVVPSPLPTVVPQSPRQEGESLDVIRTSEHKPLEANSTLVLSLSGDIGPFSSQGVGMSWGNTESTMSPAKQSGFRGLKNQGGIAAPNGTAPVQLSHQSFQNNDNTTVLQRCDKSQPGLSTSHQSPTYQFGNRSTNPQQSPRQPVRPTQSHHPPQSPVPHPHPPQSPQSQSYISQSPHPLKSPIPQSPYPLRSPIPQSPYPLRSPIPQSPHPLRSPIPQPPHPLRSPIPQSPHPLRSPIPQSPHPLRSPIPQSPHSLRSPIPQSPHPLRSPIPQSPHPLRSPIPQSPHPMRSPIPQSHPSQLPHPHQPLTREKSSSLLKLLCQQPKYTQSDGRLRLASNPSMPATAFKPPDTSIRLSSASSSLKIVQGNPIKCTPDFLSLNGPLSRQTKNTNLQINQAGIGANVRDCQDSSAHPWYLNQVMASMHNLQPSDADELQATLDVLKDMDSHYFQ